MWSRWDGSNVSSPGLLFSGGKNLLGGGENAHADGRDPPANQSTTHTALGEDCWVQIPRKGWIHRVTMTNMPNPDFFWHLRVCGILKTSHRPAQSNRRGQFGDPCWAPSAVPTCSLGSGTWAQHSIRLLTLLKEFDCYSIMHHVLYSPNDSWLLPYARHTTSSGNHHKQTFVIRAVPGSSGKSESRHVSFVLHQHC